jgi:hypothetical protein
LPGPARQVHEEGVEPAIPVVVEKRTPRAHRLGQELLPEGPGVVTEVELGVAGAVGELDGAAILRRHAAGEASGKSHGQDEDDER